MNIVFISPDFPPMMARFCAALRRCGATVLGVSARPWELLTDDLRQALTEYYRVSDMESYDAVVRAVGYFTHRYGRIDRIDSLNEHWLALEARLRTDFNVVGPREAELPAMKRKSAMKTMFAAAGVPCAPGMVLGDAAAARAFVAQVGFPLVVKPDVGVGANRTTTIRDAAAFETFLAQAGADWFIEPYVRGTIETFDGLVDRDGQLIFATSMVYSRGIMEVVLEDDEVYYMTRRVIPDDVAAAGRAILDAYQLRERFFHFEFFRTDTGGLLALEVNMRPPGGLSVDMFNYTADVDCYRLWAELLVTGRAPSELPRHYCVMYVGRKPGHAHVLDHAAVLATVGPRMVHHQAMPALDHRAMGAYGFIMRDPDESVVHGLAQQIVARREAS
jgi:hypothetical protein